MIELQKRDSDCRRRRHGTAAEQERRISRKGEIEEY
jgi:hypothetical protein